MRTIKLTVEYNGADFCGWQQQEGQRSIQGELFKALNTYLRQPPIELTASGRTDTGVHALGQVISFKTEVPDISLSKLAYGISSLMREELTVVSAEHAADDFNARFSKHIKQYSYRIFKRQAAPILVKDFAWHVPVPLDIGLMQSEAKSIIGKFDFTTFRSSDCTAKNPQRTIEESEIIEKGNELIYRVVARSFLKQMVRNIVGTLVALGSNKLPGHSMLSLMDLKDRSRAGMTAPAHGLTLDWVRYQG